MLLLVDDYILIALNSSIINLLSCNVPVSNLQYFLLNLEIQWCEKILLEGVAILLCSIWKLHSHKMVSWALLWSKQSLAYTGIWGYIIAASCLIFGVGSVIWQHYNWRYELKKTTFNPSLDKLHSVSVYCMIQFSILLLSASSHFWQLFLFQFCHVEICFFFPFVSFNVLTWKQGSNLE